MQDPNADTEWNDVLRAKGILPPKQEKEISEDDIVNLLEQTIEQKTTGKDFDEMNLKELDDIEDEIDEEEERLFEEYRRQRIAEMQAKQKNARFGDVIEITKQDWVQQINEAGEGVWVIIHVYKPSIPLCKLINQHLHNLAQKFPETKFVKSISTLCIPNYPDKNLPTLFIYKEGDMKKQFVGPLMIGTMNLTQDELEWTLSQTGAIKTELEENPRKQVKDAMMSSLRSTAADSDDDNDW